MTERLVIVGGDAAGMSAASNARRRRPDLEIVALERGVWTSYAACGIPYHVAGLIPDLEDLVARTPQEFRDRQRIDVRTEHEVVGVDTVAGTVTVRDLTRDREYALGYDQLLLATGARPTRPPLPGVDLPFVHGVQTLGDARALVERAAADDVEHVVVVGGGYIGLEMAEAFVRWGADVTVVDRAPEIMGTLDADMAADVRAAMVRHDIDVLCDTPIAGIEPGRVVLEGRSLPADLVLLGTGVQPNSGLAVDAGIPTGHKGAVVVDHRQRTEVDGVWAAGDCAESFHRVLQKRMHVALGTVANKQGRVAGINLGGGYATFKGVVGTAITRLCETEIARTGITEREAAEAGFEVRATVIESTTTAGYFPGTQKMKVKLLAEEGSGRVLGGQIVGGLGSAKRIDTLATAITAGMVLEDLVGLDLAYAPPFSPVWDPIATAARTLV
jgi:NADPH-dependent 2,4-dienoyl-CoA reductase/sulfur reductase-like enzyme